MLIFLLVLSVFRKRGRKFIGLVKAAAITAILILLILVTGLDGFFVDAVIRVNAGTSNRVALWITCLNILRSGRWLTGVGYGILDYFNAHNTYLSILLSGGILLGAFYLRFLIKTIKSYIYIIRSESDIGVYFAAIFLSYAAVSMAESITPFLSSAQNLIFTIIVFMIPQYYSNSIV
jgi:O-antigen ligase